MRVLAELKFGPCGVTMRRIHPIQEFIALAFMSEAPYIGSTFR
jgi:hypothetical protein